jgi:hypothetical protein
MSINVELLRAIGNATSAGVPVYVSQADGLPLIQHQPPLIQVDPNKVDPNDATKIAATLTTDGAKLLINGHAKPTANVVVAAGFVRPKVKRGGGRGTGAPVKYPFDTIEIGQGFFIANSEVSKGDAFKTMSSAVGSANQRYSELTGEKEQVTRAKRGPDHKTIKNADGTNVMETVTVEKRRPLRKFVVNKVEKDVEYGSFKAPDDGAFVMRVEIPAA